MKFFKFLLKSTNNKHFNTILVSGVILTSLFKLNLIYSQEYFKIENTPENKMIFDPNLKGSLMNILQNNKSLIKEMGFGNQFGRIQDVTLQNLNLDKQEFLEFENKQLMVIHRSLSNDDWIVQKSGVSYEWWIDSLLNHPTNYSVSDKMYDYEDLRLYHQKNPEGLKKMWEKAQDGMALEYTWNEYFGINDVDYMLLEDTTNILHFIKTTPKGDICTYELDLNSLLYYINFYGIQLSDIESTSIIKKTLKAAKQTSLNTMEYDGTQFIDVQVDEYIPNNYKPSLNSTTVIANLSSDQELKIEKMISDSHEPYVIYRFINEDVVTLIKTNQEFHVWKDSMLTIRSELEKDYQVSNNEDLERIYFLDSIALITSWNNTKTGNSLQYADKMKSIWVELDKPGIKVFATINSKNVKLSKIIVTDNSKKQNLEVMEFSSRHGNLSDEIIKSIKLDQDEYLATYRSWNNYLFNSYFLKAPIVTNTSINFLNH